MYKISPNCNLMNPGCNYYVMFTRSRQQISKSDTNKQLQKSLIFHPEHTTKSTPFQIVSVIATLLKNVNNEYKTLILSCWKNRNASFICIDAEKNITRLHISSDKNTNFQVIWINTHWIFKIVISFSNQYFYTIMRHVLFMSYISSVNYHFLISISHLW